MHDPAWPGSAMWYKSSDDVTVFNVVTSSYLVNISYENVSVHSYESGNVSGNASTARVEAEAYHWSVLCLLLLIAATAVGNILVCLAVCWEKRLQNMTNYFLMSLAIADLLVSLLVMPVAMVVEIYGGFPLGPQVCVLWATMDVLMCTASIWHMCTMSMDRFFTLKYPMKYGRNKTRTMVTLKIMFVWVISIAICCPVLILGFLDYSAVYNNGSCAPTIRSFILYGSVFAFYIPLTIMVVTYVLTIKILCDNQRLMKSIVKDQSQRKLRKEKNGTYDGNYLNPNMYLPRFMDHASVDTSPSAATSVHDISMPSNGDSNVGDKQLEEVSESKPLLAEPEGTLEDSNINIVNTDTCEGDSHSVTAGSLLALPTTYLSSNKSASTLRSGNPSTMSVSQPHLPGMCTLNISWPHLVLPRAKSQQVMSNWQNSNSSIPQCAFVSAGSSLDNSNSQLWGSCHCSDFEDPEILEKLSQIEQEMDACLRENGESEKHSGSQGADQELTECTESHSTAPVPPMATSSDKNNMISPSSSQTKMISSSPCLPDIPPSPDTPPPIKYDVPPVTVTSPPMTSSEDTLDDSDSDDDSDLITIHLKATGCYLYKIDPNKSSLLSRHRGENENYEMTTMTGNGKAKHDSADQSGDDDLDETSMSTSVSIGGKMYQHAIQRQGSKAWQAILRFSKRENKYKPNGALRQYIPKRTANNEKKASKVLGVIFAVFVVLWTPFFIVNILSVACEPCLEALTPSMMAAIVWLGYISSLANPIIYTMFNTAFRNAFYKILTCSYKQQYHRAQGSTPDTMHMVNTTNWTNDRNDRRNTMTLTLKEY